MPTHTISTLSLIVLCACGNSPAAGSGDGGTDSSSSGDVTAPDGDAGDASRDADASDLGADASTARFDLTIGEQPVKVDKVKVSYTPPTTTDPGIYDLEGTIPNGPDGPATFTVIVAANETGSGACNKKNDVAIRDLLYTFTDSGGFPAVFRSNQDGGSCAMTITGRAADGLSAGTASGTLGSLGGSLTTTVTWSQVTR